jgi:putative oxidoreductase
MSAEKHRPTVTPAHAGVNRSVPERSHPAATRSSQRTIRRQGFLGDEEDEMRELFLLGRIIFGGYFLFSGFEHFMNLARMTQHAAAKGVPLAGPAVALSGVLLIIGGVSILLGLLPRVGVAALVLFLVPVTLTMHQFWNEHGQARMNDMINFTKNLGLLGASLMFLVIPEPWPYSVQSRLRTRWRRPPLTA